MVDIRDYIKISDAALSFKDLHVQPKEFLDKYFSILETERDSFIRHTIINNIPYAFKGVPILYERVTQYLADKLNISPADIRLIGSAKTGFSINPPPDFGRPFSSNSDLDFSIINSNLFQDLKDEFESWAIQYRNGDLQPVSIHQEKYWPENLKTCSGTLNRGFIDANKIPSYNQFVKAQTLNNSMFLIKEKLQKVHNFYTTKATVRVYENWRAFFKQLKINTEVILLRAEKMNVTNAQSSFQ